MIATRLFPQPNPPEVAALEAKCKKCNIRVVASLDEMPKEYHRGCAHEFIWVAKCPECKDSIGFTEFFAEEIEDAPDNHD